MQAGQPFRLLSLQPGILAEDGVGLAKIRRGSLGVTLQKQKFTQLFINVAIPFIKGGVFCFKSALAGQGLIQPADRTQTARHTPPGYAQPIWDCAFGKMGLGPLKQVQRLVELAKMMVSLAQIVVE